MHLRFSYTCVALVSLAFVNGTRGAAPDYAAAGPSEVEVIRSEWVDTKRDRTIPVKIYLPKLEPGKAAEPAPVIVFSHGLGGSREGYEYLGRHWASHGLVSVHIQHPGSDEAVWKGQKNKLEAMRGAATNLQNAVNRPKDVSFSVDELLKANEVPDNPLHHRIAAERIGAAGHSFGAYTVLAVAGQSSPAFSAKDDRIKAGVAMSAPVVSGARNVTFEPIRIPMFHYTGTRDEVPMLRSGTPAERRIPFDRIIGAAQFLLIFAGGDHMIFSGRNAEKNDREMLSAIRASTTAFWDAYLRDDAQARGWLTGTTGFRADFGKLGDFELKNVAP